MVRSGESLARIPASVRRAGVVQLDRLRRTPDAEARNAKLEADIATRRSRISAKAWQCTEAFEGLTPGQEGVPFGTPVFVVSETIHPVYGKVREGLSLHFSPGKGRGVGEIPSAQRFIGVSYYLIPEDPSAYAEVDRVLVCDESNRDAKTNKIKMPDKPNAFAIRSETYSFDNQEIGRHAETSSQRLGRTRLIEQLVDTFAGAVSVT